jgi:hypothetical protein
MAVWGHEHRVTVAFRVALSTVRARVFRQHLKSAKAQVDLSAPGYAIDHVQHEVSTFGDIRMGRDDQYQCRKHPQGI